MVTASNLGFPRIGTARVAKRALEGFWANKLGSQELERQMRELRQHNWQMQREQGIETIPCNDFSLYDHVLDTCAMVGAIPDRYGWDGGDVDFDTYFRMARGGDGAIAMEMTKWFDTNYHYIVPELGPGQRFRLASNKPVRELREARELGIDARPVLLGPVSFLLLAKTRDGSFDRLSLLEPLCEVYAEMVKRLQQEGATAIQLDEPCLALDLDDNARRGYHRAYGAIREAAGDSSLMLTTYFAGLRDNLPTATQLPVDCLHVDLVREPQQLEATLEALPERMALSAGVVDGRNVWRSDLSRTLQWLEPVAGHLGGQRLLVAPSCSLLHVPVDLDLETELSSDVRQWLAFAKQKLGEVATLARGLREGQHAVADALEASDRAKEARRHSGAVRRDGVQQRVQGLTPADARRGRPFSERRSLQHRATGQPLLPTTTIGSFPQTSDIRKQRAAHRRGEIDTADYERFLEFEIEATIRFQEEIGLDVLVHGEPERNDMVQYFGEQLTGVTFTQHGWVQSYGSRYVRPPIIFGDVERPEPMTVRWSGYAQSLTDKPVKGMLTGPVTILQWSFVRDDQPRSETCRQIGLAIRDEARDLEGVGMRAIQIDEPAFREGMPLRRADRDDYLGWAVECFRLASSGVSDATQIHTHMCYSDFNEILHSIADMDADVLSLEASRSQMELLEAFARYRYPNEIGPGVYDIHSPRVPDAQEMQQLLERALEHLELEQLWVNPDCGLKTRKWDEVGPALRAMVEAARRVRRSVADTKEDRRQ